MGLSPAPTIVTRGAGGGWGIVICCIRDPLGGSGRTWTRDELVRRRSRHTISYGRPFHQRQSRGAGRGKGTRHERVRFVLNSRQVLGAQEALGVQLIYLFRAGGA